MLRVNEMIELTVRLENRPNALGQFMASATSCSARIVASCCYCDRFGTVVRIVTENAEKTAQALAAQGINCTRDSVVLIRGQSFPTTAPRIGSVLARANVQVLYSYLSWDEDNLSAMVLKTTDDARATRLLRAQVAGAASRVPASRDDNNEQCGVRQGLQTQAA